MIKKAFKTTLLTAALAVASLPAHAQENLRFGHYFPADDFRGKTAQHFADTVNPELFDITVFPSESLVKGRDGFMATARGTVDMYSLFGGYVVGSIDLMKIFTIPFPSEKFDDEAVLKFANDPRTLAIFEDKFAESNVKLLGFINSSGQTTIFLSEPIESLEGLRGKKIRGVGGYTDPALQDLGASVVFMSAAEQFLQLQTGGVDGVITTDSSYANLGLSEVAPIVIDGSIVRTPYPLIMNKRKWDSLDEESKNDLKAAVASTIDWSIENFAAESARLQEIVQSEAGGFYVFSEADQKFSTSIRLKYLEQYAQNHGELGKKLVGLYKEYE